MGVRDSADLSALVSSEVALAAEPVLEDRFLQKARGPGALTYAYADQRVVSGSQTVVPAAGATAGARSVHPCVDPLDGR